MTGLLKNQMSIMSGTLVTMMLLGFLLNGCATTRLSRQDTIHRTDVATESDNRLETSRYSDRALLSQNPAEMFINQLNWVFVYAYDNSDKDAKASIQRRLENLQKLTMTVANYRQIVEKIVEIRIRAGMKGSVVLPLKKAFPSTEDRFRGTTRMNEERPDELQPTRIENYSKTELDALNV